MKDENGIEIKCENCDDFIPVGTNGRGCAHYEEDCEDVFGEKRCVFKASSKALEARIAELQKELYVVQGSERVEAQEADRLREEVKELKARVDNLRGCLIAVICGYSKRKISPKELSARSDEALCAQVVILSSLQALLAEVEYE